MYLKENDTQGGRLRRLRKHLGMSQSDFGAGIGKGQSAIATYEQDKRRIEDASLMLLEIRYGLNREWLKYGKGEMILPGDSLKNQENLIRKIPIYDHYDSTCYSELTEDANIIGFFDMVKNQDLFPCRDIFVLHVRDDQLSPRIRKGDYVGINYKLKHEKMKGNIYLCEYDGRLALRTVQFQEDNVILGCQDGAKDDGPVALPRDEFKSVGKAVWVLKTTDL